MTTTRGGKRQGAGRKPNPVPTKPLGIRVTEEERTQIIKLLNKLRGVTMLKEIRTNCAGNRIEIVVACKGYDDYGYYYFDFDSLWSEWLADEYTAEEWVDFPTVYATLANQIASDFLCDYNEALELVESAMLPYNDVIMRGSITD